MRGDGGVSGGGPCRWSGNCFFSPLLQIKKVRQEGSHLPKMTQSFFRVHDVVCGPLGRALNFPSGGLCSIYPYIQPVQMELCAHHCTGHNGSREDDMGPAPCSRATFSANLVAAKFSHPSTSPQPACHLGTQQPELKIELRAAF